MIFKLASFLSTRAKTKSTALAVLFVLEILLTNQIALCALARRIRFGFAAGEITGLTVFSFSKDIRRKPNISLEISPRLCYNKINNTKCGGDVTNTCPLIHRAWERKP